MNAKKFDIIIKQLRKEASLTQKDFSEKIGVSCSTVAMWETGQRLPSPELYEQIADYFNVDIDYLYGRTNIRQKIRFDADGNIQRTLESDQEALLSDFDKLNAEGRQEVLKYVRNLTKIADYREDGSSSGRRNTQYA